MNSLPLAPRRAAQASSATLYSNRRTLARVHVPHRDHIYFFQLGSYVYTTARLSFPLTARPHAVLLFSIDGAPMQLEAGGQCFVGSAFAVAPQTLRRLRMASPGLISMNLSPPCLSYTCFRGIATPGVHVLNRAAFSAFEDDFAALYHGLGKSEGTEEMFRELLSTVQAQLPAAPPVDDRVPRMLEFIDSRASVSLADVAEAFDLSYHRASHLFSASVGLSFKAYQAWRKQLRVCSLLYSGSSLTTVANDADLTDSAYLSRYYQQWFGQSPSYSRNPELVQIFS